MLFTYDGIVVGRREVGDNSCYLDILTDEQGIIEAAAHGAKKINSALLSSASLFSYSTFCFSKSGLRYTINSAKPKYSFHEIGADITKLALASYFAQAVRFCTPEEQFQGVSRLQDSLVRFFAIALYEIKDAELPEQRKSARTLETVRAAFELRYAGMLGFRPDLRACFNCGCYEREHMFFLPNKGALVCGECFNREYQGESVELLPQTLNAMRHIIYSDLSKCFRFTVAPSAERQLSEITEHYFLNRTERGFGALEYYKGLL